MLTNSVVADRKTRSPHKPETLAHLRKMSHEAKGLSRTKGQSEAFSEAINESLSCVDKIKQRIRVSVGLKVTFH